MRREQVLDERGHAPLLRGPIEQCRARTQRGHAPALDLLAREPGEQPPLLPLADLRALPAATRALLDEFSEPLVGGEEPRLVPSLLRHFAHEPALLELLWTAIRQAVGGVGAEAAVLRARARAMGEAAVPGPGRN